MKELELIDTGEVIKVSEFECEMMFDNNTNYIPCVDVVLVKSPESFAIYFNGKLTMSGPTPNLYDVFTILEGKIVGSFKTHFTSDVFPFPEVWHD